MATVSIPELSPTTSPLNDNDLLVIERQSGGTKKMLFSEFLNAVTNKIVSNATNLTDNNHVISIRQMNPDINDSVYQQIRNLRAFSPLGTVGIPKNADLNNYTTCGWYHCSSSSDVPTITNCPTDIAFTMHVVPGLGGCNNAREGTNYIRQVITSYAYDHFERFAYKNDSTGGVFVFRPWVRAIEHIQTGIAYVVPNIIPGYNNDKAVTITFAHPYAYRRPIVFLRAEAGEPQFIMPYATDVSMTGFKVLIYNGGTKTYTSSIGVSWVAMEAALNGEGF